MEALVPMGVAMHIGVSNLNAQMTMDLLKSARIKPAVNQIELHPYLQQTPLIDWLRTQDIHVTGFSPLGSSSYITLRMDKSLGMGALDEDVIARIAEAHGKTPAQVVLRWGIQRGTSIVPKSVSPARLVENSQVFDFELTPAEMGAIAGLNRNLRFNDPGEFCKGMGGAYPIYA
jgi:diketogulonate reductase-like aldo/keto reductase